MPAEEPGLIGSMMFAWYIARSLPI